jgi:NAD(P)-dependent dehydrogenase (short-subunit alcohol dehydrogenase family)
MPSQSWLDKCSDTSMTTRIATKEDLNFNRIVSKQFDRAAQYLKIRKKKWGRFVGISSNMVGLAIPGMSHYITSKMGIIGFMRGLANDVDDDGITANAVLPGLTNTLAIAPQSEEQKRATWGQQAIKRLEEPRDITGAVLFLTRDDAAFITGQSIVVDGGQYRIG